MTVADSISQPDRQPEHPLAPYDAVLLLSFGGPEAPEEVLPFLQNVTRGRGVPVDRLGAVAEHYLHFGGRSPINDENRVLLGQLRAGLAAAGAHVPVYWGNRNWRALRHWVLPLMFRSSSLPLSRAGTSTFSSLKT